MLDVVSLQKQVFQIVWAAVLAVHVLVTWEQN